MLAPESQHARPRPLRWSEQSRLGALLPPRVPRASPGVFQQRKNTQRWARGDRCAIALGILQGDGLSGCGAFLGGQADSHSLHPILKRDFWLAFAADNRVE